MFIDTRNTNCLEAGKILHSALSCGLVNQAPPVCANDQNNRAILMRLRPCLKDRTQQQEAFASGLNDVSKAEKVKFPRDQAIEIKGYLKLIKGEIRRGQPGHAEQIRGVGNAIANCNRFP